jgi:D-alanyl-D-alanine carboxypeptidase (penicillin-binding protein 5/6)
MNMLRTLLLTSFLILAVSVTVHAAPSSLPAIDAKSWILTEYTSGKVLARHNIHAPRRPASLVKMMTIYVVGRAILDETVSMDDLVDISKNAWALRLRGSSKMFLEVGERVPLSKLCRGLVIPSGNDAAIALAEHLAGSQKAFVKMMNDWASRLGMDDTRFGTVHGLDSRNQKTSAADMAILAAALIRDLPDIYPLFSERRFTYQGITQRNRNKLLWDDVLHVDGIKTGYTYRARYNLVASSTSGDQRLIAVVLGARTAGERIRAARELLLWGERNYMTIKGDPAAAAAPVRVWYGNVPTVEILPREPVYLTLPRPDAMHLEMDVDLPEFLEAPVTKGQRVGGAKWILNGEVLKAVDLVAGRESSKLPWYLRGVEYFRRIFGNLWAAVPEFDPQGWWQGSWIGIAWNYVLAWVSG